MKAILLSEYNKLVVTEVATPAPGADELLIQVAACGICGSDVHGYDGSTGRRIPPIVMGHEAAGIVLSVGSEVHGYAPGDRVTFDWGRPNIAVTRGNLTDQIGCHWVP